MITSRLLIVLTSMSLGLASCGEKTSAAAPAAVASSSSVRSLEVGCAGCVFHMKGAEGCQLAVKIEGQPYLVSGVDMPGHESGMCDHSRTADLAGKLEGDHFVATSMALKP